MLCVDLEQWLRAGKFGPFAIGDSANEVTRVLGPTDWFGPKSRRSFPGYWLYDEIEFGIDRDGNIDWIQCDTVRIEQSRAKPKYLEVDWKGLVDRMSLLECHNWLERHNLAYHTTMTVDGAKVTIENHTQLLLTDSSDPRLVTVWCPAKQNDKP